MRMLGEKGASRGIFGALREDGRRKGVVRQALQTLCSGGRQKSPGTFPVSKKNQGFCSSPSEQRTAPLVRFAHRLSKMSSTEATPEHMVVVQHKEITSSNNYYCWIIMMPTQTFQQVKFRHEFNSVSRKLVTFYLFSINKHGIRQI